ncbi:MAG: hypothetical protein E6Q93_15755 [Burkholderiaceae bacterium]|nr:MAG: hypothetical protein E6Q93_15755 [Burkholderiaceae bacterium]
MTYRFTPAAALRRLSGALALLAPLAAWAGAGDITITVEALSNNVTYSRPATTSPARPALDTYVGYRISVANVGGNTINNISVVGTAAVTDPQEQALASSVDGPYACTLSASTVSCAIGQLKAGQAAAPFVVFFKAPAKDANAPITGDGVAGSCGTTDCVRLSGQLLYAETTGGTNSIPQNSIVAFGPSDVTLGTNNPTLVRSAVQKSGGTLFTGDAALTTGTNPFATRLGLPSSTTYTTAEIRLSPVPVCSVLSQCFASSITAPGTFSPYLTITLRLDASAIVKGTKIESVTVQYEGLDVGLCASPTTPRTDGFPCIASRTAYPKNSRNGAAFPIELEGDFEWILLNIRNGSYKIF